LNNTTWAAFETVLVGRRALVVLERTVHIGWLETMDEGVARVEEWGFEVVVEISVGAGVVNGCVEGVGTSFAEGEGIAVSKMTNALLEEVAIHIVLLKEEMAI